MGVRDFVPFGRFGAENALAPFWVTGENEGVSVVASDDD